MYSEQISKQSSKRAGKARQGQKENAHPGAAASLPGSPCRKPQEAVEVLAGGKQSPTGLRSIPSPFGARVVLGRVNFSRLEFETPLALNTALKKASGGRGSPAVHDARFASFAKGFPFAGVSFPRKQEAQIGKSLIGKNLIWP